MQILAKNHYLNLHYLSYPFLNFLIKRMKRSRFVGKFVKLYFGSQKSPFYYSAAHRVDYLGLRALVIHDFAIQQGICVGIRWRGLTSSLLIRFVNDKVMVERKFFMFSPLLFAIKAHRTSGVNKLVRKKSKLYYFTPQIIKKHLNIYYYS